MSKATVTFKGCTNAAFHLKAYGDTFSVLAAHMTLWQRFKWLFTGYTN